MRMTKPLMMCAALVVAMTGRAATEWTISFDATEYDYSGSEGSGPLKAGCRVASVEGVTNVLLGAGCKVYFIYLTEDDSELQKKIVTRINGGSSVETAAGGKLLTNTVTKTGGTFDAITVSVNDGQLYNNKSYNTKYLRLLMIVVAGDSVLVSINRTSFAATHEVRCWGTNSHIRRGIDASQSYTEDGWYYYPAAPKYPEWIDLYDATKTTKYDGWAEKFAVTEVGNAREAAFLFGIANTDEAVALATSAFRIKGISVSADGEATIVPPEPSDVGVEAFNGTVVIKGSATLDGEYVEGNPSARFFKACLVP